ncbi:MAG: hypothetical protein ACRDTO_17250, partial [Mycobacterium sp.]
PRPAIGDRTGLSQTRIRGLTTPQVRGPGQFPAALGSTTMIIPTSSQLRYVGKPASIDDMVGDDVESRVARPQDYDRIVAVIDDWWGRPVRASLPRLFPDHFWATSRVVEDEYGLAAFLVAFVSPSAPELAYLHFAKVTFTRALGP